MTYRHYILIGFCMVVFGAVVPFLMVMQIIESTFLLNFLAFGVSVAGLFLGLIGASQYASFLRHSKRDRDDR